MINKSTFMKLIDSKSELKEILRDEHYYCITLGEESQQEKEFYLFEASKKSDFKKGLRIGIISEGHGLKPSILFDSVNNVSYIGLNREVNVIDCENIVILKRLELDSLFYDMIPLESTLNIIIIHELGIKCISENGDIIWQYSTDVISDFKIIGETLKITTDEQIILIALSSGELVQM